MKDIDFDELDRAVSSVLSKSTPTDNAASIPAVSDTRAPSPVVMSTTPSSRSEPEPTVTQQLPTSDSSVSVSAVSQSEAEISPTPSPITLRPRGKFMDVMHPSADMNPSASTTTRPAFTPPRTLAPLSPRNSEQPESTATVDEASGLIGAEPTPVEDVPTDTLSSNDGAEETLLLPAEIEEDEAPVKPTDDASTVDKGYVDPLDVATTPEPIMPEETSRTEATTQTTPFLSDTKVDKRPLGAFGDADEQDPELTKSPADDAQTSPVVSLPRELQPDVVQVESVQETDRSVSLDKPFAASVSVAADDSDDGRVEGHPLFDTSTYHEPIAAVHPKKTAPWVFWIVGLGICLVIGAGVGYFLFTAGL